MIADTVVFAFALGVVLASPHHGHHGLEKAVTHLSTPDQTRVGIYNGNSTTINKHKYLVGLLKNGAFICSGSIVSESWILTVGDCTNGLTVEELTVVGSSSDGVTGKNYSVAQIVQHPDYGTNKLDYEYSCVQISGRFYYWAKRALSLPTAEPDDNTVMVAAGYGYTDASASSRAMTEASMTWLAKKTCTSTYKNFDFSWTDRMGCADNADGATLCKGDYGDALVADGMIYGMFSGGASSGFCTSSAKPIILADVYAVVSWIKSTTGATFKNSSRSLGKHN